MALTEEEIMLVPGLLSRRVRLAGGAKAHYVTAGATGPSVVLLHGGLPGSSGTAGWRHTAPALARAGFRVYCPDMPGFGLCDLGEEHRPAGLESHLDFLHEFVTALCLDRFHLAGNSMGTINIANYVCAHPERVLSFAMIAGFVGNVAPPQPITAGPHRPTFDGSEASMRASMEAILLNHDEITDDLVAMRTAAALRNAESFRRIPRSIAAYAAQEHRDPNVAARLSTKGRLDRVAVPGIYIYGRQDVLFPVEIGHAQEDCLPAVQFFYPDQCGHQAQTDQPELIGDLFAEFFGNGWISRRTADRAGISTRRPEQPGLIKD